MYYLFATLGAPFQTDSLNVLQPGENIMGWSFVLKTFEVQSLPPSPPFLFDMCRQAEQQRVECCVWLILVYSYEEALCVCIRTFFSD